MSIQSVLITLNRDSIPNELFKQEPRLLCIPKQAVAILGNGDSFSEGLRKFIRSFYSSSNWSQKEKAISTLSYFEPSPYEGTWGATIEKYGKVVELTGTFKQINYVAF